MSAPEAGGLFRLNGNWIDLTTAFCAVGFAVGAVLVSLWRGNGARIGAASITNDLLRGASAFPLALFALGPFFPALADAAMRGNALLLSLGAANGLFTVLADWWRNA